MKIYFFGLVILPSLLILAGAVQAKESRDLVVLEKGIELFVSPKGDDALDGRRVEGDGAKRTGPFATLERAREEIRKIKAESGLPEGGVTVWVCGGRYELKQSLAFTAEDSGTVEAPVVWAARSHDEVRISAGRMIPEFKPVSDAAVLDRLPVIARGNVLQADLRALGISEFGEMSDGFGMDGRPGTELFINDTPMWVARYPNKGFISISEALGKTEVTSIGRKGRLEGIIRTNDKHVAGWAKEQDAQLFGYWFWDWADQHQKVAKIDPATLVIELEPPYHKYGYRKGQWFYGYNLLCELDEPGEWYLNRKTGIAYVWPPQNTGTLRGMVSMLPEAVTLTGVTNVTLRGFVIEGARGDGVQMKNCVSCELVGCIVRNHGVRGVFVDGGTNCRVRGCDVVGTGDGGIWLNGGDRKTLTPSGHVAENNHIHHYSRWNRTYRPGIRLSGVGARASNNLIHDAPHQGIFIAGNDHIIEFNEFHNLCEESNDAGVIYMGRDWAARGNVIRHNFIHHLYGYEGRGCSGIYLDDCFSSALIQGNIFCKMPRAIQLGGGRDTVIENNIFVECWPALDIDSRGLGWYASGKEELTKRLKQMPYTEEPWKTRYPQLLTLLTDQPMAPKGNVISRNICVGGKWDRFAGVKTYLKFVGNMLDGDPKFVDRSKGDFRLQPDAPALTNGFLQIPVEKIGLYEDAARASWPVLHPVKEQKMNYPIK